MSRESDNGLCHTGGRLMIAQFCCHFCQNNGFNQLFLFCPCFVPRSRFEFHVLFFIQGIDRLDKDLTIGQMQGILLVTC